MRETNNSISLSPEVEEKMLEEIDIQWRLALKIFEELCKEDGEE